GPRERGQALQHEAADSGLRKEQTMIDTPVKAETFRVRTPLASKGRLDTVLSETEHMQIRIKCYAEGGENVLHAHLDQDHSFVILQGKARFHDGDGSAKELGRN